MVEWVKKASFDRLNKLFKITTIERHHQTLLSARNLLAVVQEPQPYVLNIFLRRLPKVVVPGEHFVLKDLPFYEEARAADAKARQDRLDKREKKHQERTLRQAPGVGHPVASSTAHPPIKKKHVPPLVEKALDLSSSPSLSLEIGTGSPSVGDNSD